MDVRDIPTGRLYSDLAFLWPLVSRPEEYAEEAAHWRELLREKLGRSPYHILELGVGGGHNLHHLIAGNEAVVVDLSESMLAHCRRLNPTVELHVGDMRTIRLDRTFSAVLIHDAVSHMLTESDLTSVFRTAAAHLEPGGVLITSPDFFAETFLDPATERATHSEGNLEVSYFEYTYDPDPSDSMIETVTTFLIRSPGELRIEHDRHRLGLFPRAIWIRILGESGFTAEIRKFSLGPEDRPYELIVGRRG